MKPTLYATATGKMTSVAKAAFFRALEIAGNLRSGSPIPRANDPKPPPRHRDGSLWLFVSTIGELNAIEPFLKRLLSETGQPPLTLITDRRVYRESYARKYPDAYIYEIDGTISDADHLARLTFPRLFIIAEIPCLLSDAPCRLPFAMIREARRRLSPVCIVNGWLYGYDPPSRLDAIEKRLFARDYLESLSLVTVQTDQARATLIQHGMAPHLIHVTGNTKFDAVTFSEWSATGARSERMLSSLRDSCRPCVVAGCVTEIEDQALILDAFDQVRRERSEVLLVLVPRHPENRERMAQLGHLLRERNVRHALRSELPDAPLDDSLQVLVLDTMGELKDFYGAGTVAYVGRNHNILEPLTFGKPTTISPGWEATYPSFPVYRFLMESGAVCELDSASALAQQWSRWLFDPQASVDTSSALKRAIHGLQGASARNMELLRKAGVTDQLRRITTMRG